MRLPIHIVKGVVMHLDRTEIEALHLETLGALYILDEERAQEVNEIVNDEARDPRQYL